MANKRISDLTDSQRLVGTEQAVFDQVANTQTGFQTVKSSLSSIQQFALTGAPYVTLGTTESNPSGDLFVRGNVTLDNLNQATSSDAYTISASGDLFVRSLTAGMGFESQATEDGPIGTICAISDINAGTDEESAGSVNAFRVRATGGEILSANPAVARGVAGRYVEIGTLFETGGATLQSVTRVGNCTTESIISDAAITAGTCLSANCYSGFGGIIINESGHYSALGNTVCLAGRYGISSILGGQDNLITSSLGSVVVAGSANRITGSGNSFIGTGKRNVAHTSSMIVGGNCLTACGDYTIIGGGQCNFTGAQADEGFIGAGTSNCIGPGGLAAVGSSVVGGVDNTIIQGHRNTIVGGQSGRIDGCCSFIGAGDCAVVLGNNSAVVAGSGQHVYGDFSFIGGGNENRNCSNHSVTVGGSGHTSEGVYNFIGAGRDNRTRGAASTIAGGSLNYVVSGGGAIVGGLDNTVSGDEGFIGGGKQNIVHGNRSTVAGGLSNCALFNHSFVGGGESNKACNLCATIAGGDSNLATGVESFIGAGGSNKACGNNSAVLGGCCNEALYDRSVVVGGNNNIFQSNGTMSFIGGGSLNRANGNCATLAGGQSNCANFCHTSIGGGCCNVARGLGATVAGGKSNKMILQSDASTIGGGCCNQIHTTSDFHIIAGGCKNCICSSGCHSGILGGHTNKITHSNSFAIGSSLESAEANTTFVNNLSTAGVLSAAAMYDTGSRVITNATGCLDRIVGIGNRTNQCVIVGSISGQGTAALGLGIVNVNARSFAAGTNHNLNNKACVTVGGGVSNQTCGNLATVAGGSQNCAGAFGFIGGGALNSSSTGACNVIAGGASNCVLRFHSFVGAGRGNCVLSDCSGVIGGRVNCVPSGLTETFIIGSRICATRSCTTYANHLITCDTADGRKGSVVSTMLSATSASYAQCGFEAAGIGSSNNIPGANVGQFTGYGFIGNRPAVYFTNACSSGKIIFGNNGAHNGAGKNRLVIGNTGLVGINTCTPNVDFTVNGQLSTLGNLSAYGDLQVNDDLLFADASDNRVGINTKAPNEALTVAGSISGLGSVVSNTTLAVEGAGDPNTNGPAAEIQYRSADSAGRFYSYDRSTSQYKNVSIGDDYIFAKNNGYVGIGTTSPNEALTLVGNVSATGSLSANSLAHFGGSVGIGSQFRPDKLLVVRGADAEMVVDDTNSTPVVRLRENGVTKSTIGTDGAGSLRVTAGGSDTRMIIKSTGEVGIGNTNPNEALTVTGSISATGDLNVTGTVPYGLGATIGGGLSANSLSAGNIMFFDRSVGQGGPVIRTAVDDHSLQLQGGKNLYGGILKLFGSTHSSFSSAAMVYADVFKIHDPVGNTAFVTATARGDGIGRVGINNILPTEALTVTGSISADGKITVGPDNTNTGGCAAVVGGDKNTAAGGRSGIIGGFENGIGASGGSAFIGAGNRNCASAGGDAVVGGGYNSTAGGYSFIIGGNGNTVATGACRSGIIGGCASTVCAAHTNSIITGTEITTVSADMLHARTLFLSAAQLPTTDPNVPGVVWRDGTDLKISV